MEQIDFIIAFLNSNFTDVNIYLQIPKGFNDWARFCNPTTIKILVQMVII